MGNCLECIKGISDSGDSYHYHDHAGSSKPIRSKLLLASSVRSTPLAPPLSPILRCATTTDDQLEPRYPSTFLEAYNLDDTTALKYPTTQPKVVRCLFVDTPSASENAPSVLSDSNASGKAPSRAFLSSNSNASGKASSNSNASGKAPSRAFLSSNSNASETDDSNLRCGAILDINYSNAPQLCVIGLNKIQADSVINYRVQHGHFTCKEDLRIVPGIDSETFSRIKSRITLPNGRRVSPNLARPELSQKNFEEVEGYTEINRNSSVDINYSNYHELCVVGFSESQALSLVNHRVKHGHFTCKEDIKQATGISDDNIHRRLTLVPCSKNRTPPHRPSPKKRVKKLILPSPIHQLLNSSNSFLPALDDEASPYIHDSTGLSSIVRIASWNLQCFNDKKVENKGVMEVVCTIILKHGFDLIALQEIGSKYALRKVCEELNHPTLSKVQSLCDRENQWFSSISPEPTGRMFQGMEYNGFIWNKRSGINFHQSHLINNYQDPQFVRKPFAGMFSVRNWRFVIVSVHLRAEGWGREHLKQVMDEVSNLPSLISSIGNDYGDIILLGDFNMHPDDPSFSPMLDYGYTSLFGSDDPTNISSRNPDGNKCYDNIWIKRKECYNGTHGVVRRNLQHSDSGVVSDHCPIWAGFKA